MPVQRGAFALVGGSLRLNLTGKMETSDSRTGSYFAVEKSRLGSKGPNRKRNRNSLEEIGGGARIGMSRLSLKDSVAGFGCLVLVAL